MTDRLYLDPYMVADLEPDEGSPSNQQFISPFSVPEGLEFVKNRAGMVSQITFRYPGGEKADAVEPIDEQADPRLQARMARRSGKLMALEISPPADADTIKRISARLEQQSTNLATKARPCGQYLGRMRYLG